MKKFDIPKILKKLRKDMGLTQKEMGDLLGVCRTNICRYESRKTNMKLDTIEKILDLYNKKIRSHH